MATLAHSQCPARRALGKPCLFTDLISRLNTSRAHGSIDTGYFVSAREYAELERLRAYERRAPRVEELPAEVFEAIVSTRMDPAHDHLNALLEE